VTSSQRLSQPSFFARCQQPSTWYARRSVSSIQSSKNLNSRAGEFLTSWIVCAELSEPLPGAWAVSARQPDYLGSLSARPYTRRIRAPAELWCDRLQKAFANHVGEER
jgi:hypothetical protein